MRRRQSIGATLLAAIAVALPAPAVAATSATAASGCPTHSPAVPTHQGWAPATLTLAPAGATSVRVCRYSGLNAHPRLSLTAGALIHDPVLVDQVVARLDRLAPGPSGPVACPDDDLSQIVVTLGYPGGHSVAVSVGLAGCETVTNGAVNRTGAGVPGQPEPGLIAWLARLTRPAPPSPDDAAAVARDRWSIHSAGPLGARAGAAAVWDGHALLVVGGTAAARPALAGLTSGAAFDPLRSRWRAIARAPLPISAVDATVWTGQRLFAFPAATQGATGASPAELYDPTANRWTVTRPAPTGPLSDPVAVRSGDRVVVIGVAAGSAGTLRAAAFDPATGTWTTVDPPVPADHPASGFVAVGTPAGVLLWSLWWSRSTAPSAPGSFTSASGIDVFRLTGSETWSNVTGDWPQAHTVDQPILAGATVLLAPGQIWCGACPHPAPFGEHSVQVDPVTLNRATLPHGPLDDLGPEIVWTGAAELAVNARGETMGPAGNVRPGDLAVLDLTTRRWTRLARAPAALGQNRPVWADHRLLAFATDGRLLVDGPPRPR